MYEDKSTYHYISFGLHQIVMHPIKYLAHIIITLNVIIISARYKNFIFQVLHILSMKEAYLVSVLCIKCTNYTFLFSFREILGMNDNSVTKLSQKKHGAGSKNLKNKIINTIASLHSWWLFIFLIH